ncbi:MAG: GNAT family N-acetyltransferase [Gaiellaceae bacterium]
MIRLRPAIHSDADLEAYVGVWNAVTPVEPTSRKVIRERLARQPQRLYLLAERAGAVVGCGFAGPSDSPGRGFLSPRVLPDARRRGVGAGLLHELADHLAGEGFETASAHVDGRDEGSFAFARRFGFEETDRQVEQVLTVGDAPPVEPPEGVRFVTISERPALLREAYELAVQGYADMATSYPVVVPLEDWLRDEATLPAGSFAALAGDEIVGYAGLCRRDDGTVEDGLTVVRREWRRRGLATALKRAELAWAAANGIGEIVSWTQRGNVGMRAVNERLGYVYGSVTVSVRAPLPLAVE